MSQTEVIKAPRQATLKTLLGTSIGNALEWYDWNVYGSFAIYFSSQLFYAANPTSAFMSTMAVFAVGFVARPFGSAFFGWLGDRMGRKHALVVAVLCASGGSLLIAVCPTYTSAGVFSSVLLVIARLVQGLAHGGELPSAQTYLAEVSPPRHRGLWSSAIYFTGTLGNLLGLILGLVLRNTLGADAMNLYGWRIPFALGAVLGVVAFWIRTRLEETEAFETESKRVKEHRNLAKDVLKHWRTGLQVIGMTCGLTTGYYIWSVSTASVAQANLGYSSNAAFTASIIGNIVFMISLPLWGIFSDRFGRKINMLIAMVGCAVLYVPLSNVVSGGTEWWRLALVICIMLILLGAYLGIAPAAYGELFPTSVRVTAFGVPYAIAVAAFGGTAPYIMSALKAQPNVFVGYVILLLVISAVTILTLKESKGKDLVNAQESAPADTQPADNQ